MQKWEYCKLTGVTDFGSRYPECYRMTGKGHEIIEDFSKLPK